MAAFPVINRNMEFFMKYAEIKREWGNYYRGISSHCVSRPFNPLKKEMDAFAEANPGLSPMMLPHDAQGRTI